MKHLSAMGFRRSSTVARQLASLVMLVWLLAVSVASPGQPDTVTRTAATIQALEEAVMPSVDPRSEVQVSQGFQVSCSPFPELEISNEKVAVTFRRGLSVDVTASNPFYVNPSINAP